QVALTGHVVVQRHRLDPEYLAEPAHAQRPDAAFVSEGDRGLQHLVAAQARPPGRHVPGRRHLAVLSSRVDEVTPVIDRTYPLAEAPQAIRRLQTGQARGKIVITVPS